LLSNAQQATTAVEQRSSRDAHQARPVSALRQLITGVVAEKVAMEVSAKRVPQRERDIEALNGQEFGKNSVGARTKQEPAA